MRLIIISGLFLMVYASLTAATCSTNEYQCADGVTCIPNSQLCDSSLDCPAGDDEESTNCVVDPTACPNTCPEGQYLCTDCSCKTSQASCPNQISTESTTVKGSDPPEKEEFTVWTIIFIVIAVIILIILVAELGVIAYKRSKQN